MSHPILKTFKLPPEEVHKRQETLADVKSAIERGDEGYSEEDMCKEDREADLEECKQKLQPVSAKNLDLPKLPLVRIRQEVINNDTDGHYKECIGRTYIMLGEIIGMSGHVTLIDVQDGTIIPVMHDFEFEMLVPYDDY